MRKASGRFQSQKGPDLPLSLLIEVHVSLCLFLFAQAQFNRYLNRRVQVRLDLPNLLRFVQPVDLSTGFF